MRRAHLSQSLRGGPSHVISSRIVAPSYYLPWPACAQGVDHHSRAVGSRVGYVVHGALRKWGYACDVIAPSLIAIKPGVQRKHDKYDAVQLARLYRAGELTAVRIPTAAEELVRDVVRCRETFQREIFKSRHYIRKFLARRSFVYHDSKPWGATHVKRLRALAAIQSPLAPEDALVVRKYFALLEYKITRREELDRQIAVITLAPKWATTVGWLQYSRGLQLHSAMVLTTEIVGWRRFARPTQLMAYLGLVPREASSGERECKGSITKAGNHQCRHVLVQAAWSYRHTRQASPQLKSRQAGQPTAVIAHAWKAQRRLHKLYQRSRIGRARRSRTSRSRANLSDFSGP